MEEKLYRIKVFEGNYARILAHNAKGLSYTLGVNEHADLTWEEFQGRLGASGQECSATVSQGAGCMGQRLEVLELALAKP